MLNQPAALTESSGELARLREDAIAFYRPVSSQEHFAVERIALAQQSMRRAARLESSLFANPPGKDLISVFETEAFKLFLRFQAQAERAYHSAVREFLFLRENRACDFPAQTSEPPKPASKLAGTPRVVPTSLPVSKPGAAAAVAAAGSIAESLALRL
jgi:hypothetical protein